MRRHLSVCPDKGQPQSPAVVLRELLRGTWCEEGDRGRTVDWSDVLALARVHGVSAFLYWSIRYQRAAAGVPAEIEERLRVEYFAAAAQSAALQCEVDRIAAALSAESVQFVVLKGAALARTVYAEAGLRTMGDVDLLIPHECKAQTVGCLTRLGYTLRSSEKVGYRPEAYLERFGKEWAFSGPLQLEVHYKLLGGEWARRASRMEQVAAEVMERARPLPGSPSGLTLCVEDALLHAGVHLAINHSFHGTAVKNLLDIRLMAEGKWAQVAWPTVVERARDWRVATACYEAFTMAVRLFQAPIPARVLDALRPQGGRAWLLSSIVDPAVVVAGRTHRCGLVGHATVVRPPFGGIRRLLLHLLLVDRRSDMARLLWGSLCPDREWITLRYDMQRAPGWRLFLQRLWHPLRILYRGQV